MILYKELTIRILTSVDAWCEEYIIVNGIIIAMVIPYRPWVVLRIDLL